METVTYGLSPKPTTGKTLSKSRKWAGAQVPLSSKKKGATGLIRVSSSSVLCFLSTDHAKQQDYVTGMLLPLHPVIWGWVGGLGQLWGAVGQLRACVDEITRSGDFTEAWKAPGFWTKYRIST